MTTTSHRTSSQGTSQMINSFARSMTPIARSFISCSPVSPLIVRMVNYHPSYLTVFDSLGMCMVDF